MSPRLYLDRRSNCGMRGMLRGDGKGGIVEENSQRWVRVCGGELGRLIEGLCRVGERGLTRKKDYVLPNDGGWVGQVGDGVGKGEVDMVKKEEASERYTRPLVVAVL
jgi:hypothetical protein